MFCEAGFKLHKWHSNVPALEGKQLIDKTFGKQQLGMKTNETEKAKVFWIKHKQGKVETTDNFKEDQDQLTL